MMYDVAFNGQVYFAITKALLLLALISVLIDYTLMSIDILSLTALQKAIVWDWMEFV